ncbi:MAG: hypothetical protein AAGI28_03490 [Pseudomonadota bacterium]
MALSSLSKRVTALEPPPSRDWGEFLDTLSDNELERLESIVFKLNPDGQPGPADMTEAEAEAHFSVLTEDDFDWFTEMVQRKGSPCVP